MRAKAQAAAPISTMKAYPKKKVPYAMLMPLMYGTVLSSGVAIQILPTSILYGRLILTINVPFDGGLNGQEICLNDSFGFHYMMYSMRKTCKPSSSPSFVERISQSIHIFGVCMYQISSSEPYYSSIVKCNEIFGKAIPESLSCH